MGETPEQKYERISRAVQESILRNYPNPERRGCPGDDVVRTVAARSEVNPDTLWEHITHCSPCYAVFLRCKQEFRKRAAYRRVLLPIAVAAGIAIGSWITLDAVRQHKAVTGAGKARNATPPTRPPQERALTHKPLAISVDLRSQAALRGSYERVPQAPIHVPQSLVEFKFLLPFASDDGSYQVEVLDAQQRPTLRTTGTAVLVANATALKVRPLDFASVAAGEYLLRFRHGDSTWHLVPVTVP
jgi:hypothetical protein